MTNSGARLQIEGLTVIYDGEIAAVGDVDLEIHPGEFLTLLGPSGSGKTSVLRTIAGFVQATTGRILLDDYDLVHLPPNERNLGLVFQDYALFPHMTVAENVGFPLRMRQWSHADIDSSVSEALKMVKLSGYERRKPVQLSGGEQQRVALARSTVFNPPLMLMDEPLGALDRQLREHLQIELQAIQARTGITTLYVTHDQSEAMMLSDRIAVMRDGNIEQLGTPQELYEHPINRFVAEFIGDSNIVSGILTGTATSPLLETKGGLRIPLESAGGHRRGETINVLIRPERIETGGNELDVRVPGRVTDVAFTGDMLRIAVASDACEKLLVKMPNRSRMTPPRVSEEIVVGWDRDDAIILNPVT